MKTIKFIILLSILSISGFSQVITPIKFKATQMSVATPDDGELYFFDFFYSKPVNVNFNGNSINVSYDNGKILISRKIKSYIKTTEYENNAPIDKFIIYAPVNDTISSRYDSLQIIVDNRFKYINFQIIIPSKDVYGENFVSYRQFESQETVLK